MITEQELEQAIAECQGERNPNANTCIKLAAFYTIKNEMYGKNEPADNKPDEISAMPMPAYSMLPPPVQPIETPDIVDYISDSDFAQAIHGRSSAAAWALMDELMDTIAIVNPRLYDSVMRKLQR